MSKAICQVYEVATVEAAEARLNEFTETWGVEYPTIIRLWKNAWEEFTPFLAWDVETRRIISEVTPRILVAR